MKLLKKFYQILESRRRRREVRNIRREFGRAGYPLDQFRDSQIEAALRPNTDVGFTNKRKNNLPYAEATSGKGRNTRSHACAKGVTT
jgi:hypothetical protein